MTDWHYWTLDVTLNRNLKLIKWKFLENVNTSCLNKNNFNWWESFSEECVSCLVFTYWMNYNTLDCIVDIVYFSDQLILSILLSPGALIVYAAILNQKLTTSIQKKQGKRKKRPKQCDEVMLENNNLNKIYLRSIFSWAIRTNLLGKK